MSFFRREHAAVHPERSRYDHAGVPDASGRSLYASIGFNVIATSNTRDAFRRKRCPRTIAALMI